MAEPTTATTGKVVVGYLHPGEVAHSFHISWDRLRTYDFHNSQRVYSVIAEECGAGRITEGRNHVVRKFLETPAEWLLFIDADMGFDPKIVDQFLSVADPVERPIVGGLAFAQRKGPESGFGARWFDHVPTVYRWVDHDHIAGVVPIANYPRNALVKVDATGAACLFVHRSVFETMRETFPPPLVWFADTIYKNQVFGEDITFCRRAAEAGFPIYVHTGIQTSHYKSGYISEQTAQTNLDAPTFVVIPVKDRLDLTRSLLEELESQGGYESIFVMDNGSGEETRQWLAEQQIAEVYDAAGLNYHEMCNIGINLAESRAWPNNVAILNNDLKVGPNFLEGLAVALRSEPSLGVVSPNYDGRPGSGLQQVYDICAGRYDGTGGLAGFALMFRGESGYRFPEELNWWFGDNHLLTNVLLGGSAAAIVLDVTCEHIDGGSQTGDWEDPEMVKLLEADRRWFEAWISRFRPTDEEE